MDLQSAIESDNYLVEVGGMSSPFLHKPSGWTTSIKRLLGNATEGWNGIDVSAGLTLALLILLHVDEDWYVRAPIVVLCIAAFVRHSLYRKASFWLVISLVLAVKHYGTWYAMENHEYLINYWCLALCLSFLTPDPRKAIAVNARLLIGLAFAFATFWKLISSDYLDGTFFQFLLLTSEHFRYVASTIGGLASETIRGNHQAVLALYGDSSAIPSVQLHSSVSVPWIAGFLTGWTLILEGSIAVSFLSPMGRFVSRWRDALLLVFLVTTYLITPVVGFGWILAAMGVAQCNVTFRQGPLLYVAAFLVIELFNTPWMDVAARLI